MLHRFTLDLTHNASQVQLRVKTSDDGHDLWVNVMNGGVPYELDECTAILIMKAPDGTITSDDDVEVDTGSLQCALPDLSDAGIYEAEFRITDEDGRGVTTPRFSLAVEERLGESDG